MLVSLSLLPLLLLLGDVDVAVRVIVGCACGGVGVIDDVVVGVVGIVVMLWLIVLRVIGVCCWCCCSRL